MNLESLPIFPLLPEIARALEAGCLVLSAETGAGKTSAVPAYLAASGALPGKAIVLEPRRLAAVSAAARVSELLGTELGGTVGYRIRGDSRAGRGTRVEFVTEAVFLRMVQDDPLLSGVSLVVFDEFHERSAAGDLSLAFAAEAREARGDLSILAMSATMDTRALARYLGCPTLDAPGRLYPVETSYRPPSGGEDLHETVAAAVLEALESTEGDVLAFLPGLREIRATEAELAARLGRSPPAARLGLEIRALHGSLPLAEQQAVVAPRAGAGRRAVLATNVAETSLTVPRISAVVDSGRSRLARLHAPSGLTRLVTERVSAAEAGQRRGRAGRLGPGLCVRCWNEADILPASRGPELARIELSATVLECALRGSSSLESVRWLDAPPPYAWDAAVAALEAIGLVDERGAATGLGRRAAALGTEPRAAAALLRAEAEGGVHAAALAAAALSEREGPDSDGDFRSGLERTLEGAARGPRADGRSRRVVEEADRLIARLARGAGSPRARGEGGPGALDPAAARSGIATVGDLLAPGFPDRLARRLGDGTWEFSSGRRARAASAPPRAEWLLALDVDAGDPLGSIRVSAPVGAAAAKAALRSGARATLEVEWRGLAASAWERTRAGVFALGERRLAEVPREALAEAFAAKLRSEGLEWLPWNDDSRSLLDRARFVAARADPEAATGGRDAYGDILERVALAAGDWLSPSGPVLGESGFAALLGSVLGRETLDAIERAAPAFVSTPGGRRRRPAYPRSGPARLAARIQEFFGMAQGPKACGEPMTLELLSPADRPVQTTSDLAGFWRSTYPLLRPELARRYPRHYWPLDPLVAPPTRGPKPKA